MDDANTTSCREVAAATQTRICLALRLIERKCSHTSIKARSLSSSVFFPLAALTPRKGCSVRKKRRELPGLKNFEVTRGHKVVLVCYLTLQLSTSLEY